MSPIREVLTQILIGGCCCSALALSTCKRASVWGAGRKIVKKEEKLDEKEEKKEENEENKEKKKKEKKVKKGKGE